jgi:hypothetical protein
MRKGYTHNWIRTLKTVVMLQPRAQSELNVCKKPRLHIKAIIATYYPALQQPKTSLIGETDA